MELAVTAFGARDAQCRVAASTTKCLTTVYMRAALVTITSPGARRLQNRVRVAVVGRLLKVHQVPLVHGLAARFPAAIRACLGMDGS